MDWISSSPLRLFVFALTLSAGLSFSPRSGAAQDPAPYQGPAQAPQQVQPAPQPVYPQQPPAGLTQPYPQQPVYPQQQPPAGLTQPYPQQPGYGQQPVYAQPTYAPVAPVRAPRPSRGMMITGISILGGSYLVTAIVGVSLLDTEDSDFEDDEYDGCRECGKIGGLMLVPVFGPFLAMGPAENGHGILALLGTVQLVGAGLTIGGIIRFKNSKRRYEEAGGYTFDLPRGRTLSLDVGTSPYMAGPRMKLSF